MIDQGTFEHMSRYISSLIERGERIDGRKFKEYRKIRIIPNYVKNAEGSCYVELGNTKVIAGVDLGLGTPFPDTPNEGVFITSLEFLPSSFPTVEPGPPGPEAIELARVIDRAIRESRFIKTEELVIESGKTVWEIFIDIYVLNDDGNIVDAGMLATLGALMTAKFPELEKVEDTYRVNPKVKTEKILPLNMDKIPLTFSFAKINDKLILDPNKYEEESANMLVHIGISEKGIHGVQTRRSGTIKLEEFMELVSWAYDLYPKIKKILLNSLK
ncbi:MAG TPA: exosome complex protein Rrp42 [Candidatus Nanopusillus sp.]|nr:exosome complex protein Rrp42 [Candidatus Nanopusillus sp.]